jgi:predicted transcriptional regulator
MSAIKELENEQVRHLDLSRYCRVESGTPVRDVLAIMRRERCRAVLITRGDTLAGIFTERDALRRVVLEPNALDGPIDAVMTHNPITVAPDTSAAAALWLMDEHRFRNLPVMDVQGRIVGDMTHAAVITYLAGRYPEEVLNRSPRPEQYPRKAEGG